jgi:cytochrome c oxidase subunit 2
MEILRKLRRAACLAISCLISLPALAYDRSNWNMPRGVTPISRDIYDLHMTIFWICAVIGALVFGVLIYSLVKHRKSKGYKPAKFHESLKVEIIWAVIPFLILVAMAVPATLVLMKMEDGSEADINIKVTGYQWKWKYEYLDQGISFFSSLSTPRAQIEGREKRNKWYLLQVDNPLVLPIHKKVRFLVTSNDVIHSWWVPALGVKRDAIPGFIYQAWAYIEKPGTYRGQCAELCGVHHGYMPIVVKAVAEADFKKWVASKTKQSEEQAATPAPDASKDDLMKKGKVVYDRSCAVCHKPDGSGMPPAFPALKGGEITTGPVKGHVDIVLNGKTGTAMQAFKDQLSNDELAAVITYERNAWGNDDQDKYGKQAGGLVQSAEIAKAKG